ncbi:UDP-N-acetylglucosamine--peptide N-acetylglucosaminyltransferase 110kDa subunit like protein [Aduncisulcus paluster]|uniref:UDP-N-acetylglucosamine--peptide N-acetylglucosaminyltransferase 110kDa subunit like protein n=1 Tax=Aduncisulcus paluster TaxID=2918883 RepID=A0ABQ5KYB9_9EUKA|nr:UDP-N-acetylglucosamine--peptide N-acetylglucosaminyltransferase 110kDa subunit like protein [Aduncisulcus paluster]|eukprot:gnl/Carplike_NY0171/1448_a1968_699.p1 GENE.gnl/Carplike_NY0171/1448_a1968_699~~gnl/Carplike_NY0171/1448_a1968_699.p1  ORF type:complete len:727 (+),score=143.98 gnl/Carplike_NY0171/1448_a1968_699:44-2224(+)
MSELKPSLEDECGFRLQYALSMFFQSNFNESLKQCITVLEMNPDHMGAMYLLVYLQTVLCDWEGYEKWEKPMFATLSKQLENNQCPLIEPFRGIGLPLSPQQSTDLCKVHSTAIEMIASLARGGRPEVRPQPLLEAWIKRRIELKEDEVEKLHEQELDIGKRRSSASICRSDDSGSIVMPSFDTRTRVLYITSMCGKNKRTQFLSSFLSKHDRSKFHITLFCVNHTRSNIWTRHLESCVDSFDWVPTSASVYHCARRVAAHKPDIVVSTDAFLSYSREVNPIIALRPGIVQVSAFGYHSSMQAAYFDYILADSTVITDSDRATYLSEATISVRECCIPCGYDLVDRALICADEEVELNLDVCVKQIQQKGGCLPGVSQLTSVSSTQTKDETEAVEEEDVRVSTERDSEDISDEDQEQRDTVDISVHYTVSTYEREKSRELDAALGPATCPVFDIEGELKNCSPPSNLKGITEHVSIFKGEPTLAFSMKRGRQVLREIYGIPVEAYVCGFLSPMYKLDRETFRLFLGILKSIAARRRDLGWTEASCQCYICMEMANDEAYVNLQKECESVGFDSHHMIRLPKQPRHLHIRRCMMFDVAFESPLCDGMFLTSDALWCGVPVICQMGDKMCNRITSSMLKSINLSCCVCRNKEEMVQIAHRLAFDHEFVKKVRGRILKARVESLGLFDTKGFVRDLEEAYAVMRIRIDDAILKGVKVDPGDILMVGKHE